ncbi:MAG TPA: thiamine phosphate synthase [Gemmatimonadales bacterium]|nr:thiamine phosphate synthase [Gemmatimonadales bacterium]
MTLPRLHAVTDGDVLARADFLERLTAIATLGSRVAVHLRDRDADARTFWQLVERAAPVVRQHGAMLVVNARPDIAAMVHAHAVQLGDADLSVDDARRVAAHALVGRSVHELDEGRRAVGDGADYLLVGNVHQTPSHPGRPGLGLARLSEFLELGRPVIAIGGITPEAADAVHAVGAWGVAAIRAVWDAPDPAAAAEALLVPWERAA